MPTDNKKRLVCFIRQSQLQKIEEEAIKNGVSRSKIIRRLLDYGTDAR